MRRVSANTAHNKIKVRLDAIHLNELSVQKITATM